MIEVLKFFFECSANCPPRFWKTHFTQEGTPWICDSVWSKYSL